jgi:mercuric ion transport protein
MNAQQADITPSDGECRCSAASADENRLAKWTTAGGILAALGICAACCLLPFILLSLGIAGAWIGALDGLAPYKWIFIASTAALLGYSFYVVYWKRTATCAAGSQCKTCRSNRQIRIALWVATVLAIGGIIFEQVEPYLIS